MNVLVLDSSPLSCFAKAKQLPMLELLTGGYVRVTTRAVLDELRQGVRDHPEIAEVEELSWLQVEPLDSLAELRIFAAYSAIFGNGPRDIGEATVLAWAEAHGATAMTDDQVAVQAAQSRGVAVVRTLALVARGVHKDVLTRERAESLVEELLRAGARFPLGLGQFVEWAARQGLF
jgi:predicted nucleic acid-binding protein